MENDYADTRKFQTDSIEASMIRRHAAWCVPVQGAIICEQIQSIQVVRRSISEFKISRRSHILSEQV